MEITIDEGVELNQGHIERIEEGLLEKYDGPYGLLINRKNPYSHTCGSMEKVARLRNLAALAIIAYSDLSRQIASVHQLYQKNVRIFQDRDQALIWLGDILSGASEI
jgi:hypothetical protein